ncbi:hypothetical protein KM176_10990 [Pseudooceanicola sp. CBS1P-1]|uniref:Uncharacterized protein n=1 Tax=Pseudooceanicola albus TaxID=2692189 RepID=A0A6L7G8N6_9RHOB|nr:MULTISPECIES: replication initiation protein RepC [Pseudooceanicola]MBT9384384.1 hypothetical protein [Pseudooceanicola endophyticus]MXN19878.1 hypothetical protein [Pseudooceanicola albus]
MKTIMTAASLAGARESRVQTQTAGFAPVLRRDLLCALRDVRRPLGLSTGDLLVLDTLLSFLPCKDPATGRDGPVHAGLMTIIYASNATLCARANGMDERVLRRHVARLVSLGLLSRRDSATGKRFPLRAEGRIRSAFGLDLAPLLCRSAEILELADTRRAEQAEIRALRAEALALRAALLKTPERLSCDQLSDLDALRNTLRRSSLDLGTLRDILDGLSTLAASQPAPMTSSVPTAKESIETEKESAADGQNVRHIETKKIDTFKDQPITPRDVHRSWQSCPNIASFYPQPPTNDSELTETIFNIGSFMGLRTETLVSSLSALGWRKCLVALEYLIEKADQIRNPNGYLRKMVSSATPSGRPALAAV